MATMTLAGPTILIAISNHIIGYRFIHFDHAKVKLTPFYLRSENLLELIEVV